MKTFYFLGRTLQLIGLLAMPGAILVAEIAHSESGAIGIFLGSVLIFFIGYLFTRLARR